MTGTSSRWLIAAGTLITVVVLAVLLTSRGGRTPSPPAHAAPPIATSGTEAMSATTTGEAHPPGPAGEGAPAAEPAPSASSTAQADIHSLSIRQQAELLGDTDLSDGLDLPPPPLPIGPPVTMPETPPADPARVIEDRTAGLALLDQTLERLEREAAAAERAGDSEAASRLRIRIARTTDVRARREQELEVLRAGGELPTTDPEQRWREGTFIPEPE